MWPGVFNGAGVSRPNARLGSCDRCKIGTMKLYAVKRLSRLVGCIAAAAMAWLPVGALAQGSVAKPIHIIVPFGPGGVADLTVRTVGQKLAEILNQPVIIYNKPGAGGLVAGDSVARAEADGNTLLLISNGTAVTANLFKKLPFDVLRDFTPISTLGYFDLAILTSGTSSIKSLPDLLAYAKANPGKLNLGTISIGSTQNLAAELFKSTSGLDVQVVPFNGTPAVITAQSPAGPGCDRRSTFGGLARCPDAEGERAAGLCGAQLERSGRAGENPEACSGAPEPGLGGRSQFS